MLDLSQSEAKITRALVHHEALKAEVARITDEREPYTISGELDHDTGWFHAFLTATDEIADHGLSTIVGDMIHNLRSALDYIVTALVDASPNATLGQSHQFPIFDDRVTYKSKISDEYHAVPGGWLDGVTVGLQEIWNAQPFHRQAFEDHPLWIINRLSNADKHRMLFENWIEIGPTTINVIVPPGEVANVVESVPLPKDISLDPQRKIPVSKMRFAPPYPTQVQVEATSPVTVSFGTPPFGRNKSGNAIAAPHLFVLCEYVAKLTDIFKAL